MLPSDQALKLAQIILVPPIKDVIETNDNNYHPLKEHCGRIWSTIQDKFSNNPAHWCKIQNIYNAIKHGYDKQQKSKSAKKRKISEYREKVKRLKTTK